MCMYPKCYGLQCTPLMIVILIIMYNVMIIVTVQDITMHIKINILLYYH